MSLSVYSQRCLSSCHLRLLLCVSRAGIHRSIFSVSHTLSLVCFSLDLLCPVSGFFMVSCGDVRQQQGHVVLLSTSYTERRRGLHSGDDSRECGWVEADLAWHTHTRLCRCFFTSFRTLDCMRRCVLGTRMISVCSCVDDASTVSSTI